MLAKRLPVLYTRASLGRIHLAFGKRNKTDIALAAFTAARDSGQPNTVVAALWFDAALHLTRNIKSSAGKTRWIMKRAQVAQWLPTADGSKYAALEKPMHSSAGRVEAGLGPRRG
jgi:hypothetical protein